jgi:hypothetical protein
VAAIASDTFRCFQAVHSTSTEILRRIRADVARDLLTEKGSLVAVQQRALKQRRLEILESCSAAAQRCSVAIGLLLGRYLHMLISCHFFVTFNGSHHLVSHWASSWVIRCLILAGDFTSAVSLLITKCRNLSPATIAQQRLHQKRTSFAPWRTHGMRPSCAVVFLDSGLTFLIGSSIDWLQLFVDSDVASEVSLAGSIGCSPLDLSSDDMRSIVGDVPLALQASCMRLVLSLYRSGLYEASSACLRALIGGGSSEAMSIPRHTLDALQSLPHVLDMTVDERCHVLGMSSINAWNRNGFDSFDGRLCHGPPDLFLVSRSFTTRCCASLASALASSVRITALFLDDSVLADSGCSALCTGLASNKSLNHLSVRRCKFTVEACRDLRLLLATPGGPPLLVLDISGNSVLDSGVALIGEGLKHGALADSHSSLHRASHSAISDHLHDEASKPPSLSLCVLRASFCAFSSEGAFALCSGAQVASSNGHLHTLDLSRNPLGKVGVGYVAWLLQTQGNRMKHIDVRECCAPNCAAAAVATALSVASDLEKSCGIPVLMNGLKNGKNVFFVDGVAYDVDGNVIENATVLQPEFKLHLNTLHIGGGDCSGADDADSLGFGNMFVSIGRLSCLVNLSVISSPISRSLESHAAYVFMCCSLRSLTLDDCIISPGGARAIAQGMKKGACILQYLSVQGCHLGDIGVGHLECAWTESAGPATLKISSNDIHDRGALHLSRMIASSRLCACYADDNSIGPQGFALMAESLCSRTSRVQLLHVNNNNVGVEGASALFRYLGRSSPLEILHRDIEVENEFVTSRGTRVPRELQDLQKEHLDGLEGYAADSKRNLDRAGRSFAELAAATATSHGKYRDDADEYINGISYKDIDGCNQWSWLETVEMRSNSIGPGCENDLIRMIEANSSLQVPPEPHFTSVCSNYSYQILDIRMNSFSVTQQVGRFLLQLVSFMLRSQSVPQIVDQWNRGTVRRRLLF